MAPRTGHAATPRRIGSLAAAALLALSAGVVAADAPVKPEKPVVAPAPAATGAEAPAVPAAPGSTGGSTQVPALAPNFVTRSDSWTYAQDTKAREPFSYARGAKKKRIEPIPGTPSTPDNTKTQDKVFVAGMPRDYGNALGQFTAAVEALGRSDAKSRDANLDVAKNQLNGCLANLDSLRSQAAKFEKSNLEAADKKQFDYYYAAANRLQRAARQQYDWVNLQIRFSAEVLHKPKYAIAAIQAHRENPAWPFSAVLFEGIKDPVKVGEVFPKQEGPTPPELEMKILSLTPTTITVLFQHQATFEIPVNPDAGETAVAAPAAGKK